MSFCLSRSMNSSAPLHILPLPRCWPDERGYRRMQPFDLPTFGFARCMRINDSEEDLFQHA